MEASGKRRSALPASVRVCVYCATRVAYPALPYPIITLTLAPTLTLTLPLPYPYPNPTLPYPTLPYPHLNPNPTLHACARIFAPRLGLLSARGLLPEVPEGQALRRLDVGHGHGVGPMSSADAD